MTGHWEFTYGEKALRSNLERFKGEFLAQNVYLTEEAVFNGAEAFDSASGRVFKPATIKEIGGHHIAVVGQAFPYVPIAHPKRFTPGWTFGIHEEELQQLIDTLRNGDKAVPQPTPVTNAGGTTLVTNAGSNGKFLGVLDLDLARGRVSDIRYRLLPVFSELLKPDPAMAALSPGFRWGPSFLPGQPLTMEEVLSETAISYPETCVQSMTGSQITDALEDVCDNLFNADPYYQQGGDMVRVGGFTYTCMPAENIGRRISDLKLDNGRSIEAGKSYKVASWASVNQQRGMPVWDVFARYLGSGKTLDARGDGVTLRGVDGNPGIAGHG
jgi:sulfur-oxidizing protein SoxB